MSPCFTVTCMPPVFQIGEGPQPQGLEPVQQRELNQSCSVPTPLSAQSHSLQLPKLALGIRALLGLSLHRLWVALLIMLSL